MLTNMDGRDVEGQEKIVHNRPRLLLHGTHGPDKQKLLVEYGLLAQSKRPLLTPNLELALNYASHGDGLLTFWYPKHNEVGKIYVDATVPSTPLSEEEKQKIIEGISNSDINEYVKEAYIRNIVNPSNVVLPPSSLGAIARLKSNVSISLLMHLPFHNENFLKKYTSDKEGLLKDMEKGLNMSDVVFFDPKLTIQRLTEDLITSGLEHYLLEVGDLLANFQKREFVSKQDEANLIKERKKLDEVRFSEKVYERYRVILVSRIAKLLKT